MKVNSKSLLLAGALSACLAGTALAAGFFTNGVPPAGGTQYPTTLPLTGNETIPADTNLPSGLNPASESITTLALQGFTNQAPARLNTLIGGDAGTNLFQRGTSGASQTGTVAYGGPDRWAYWAATATAMTVSQDTTAADLPPSFQAAFKMARTSGNTGTTQMCMAQEVETANSYQMAGNTAELDFHAIPGANFSPTNGAMTAYITVGQGTDEGISKMAYGLNGGGGGTTGWTSQATPTAAVVDVVAGTNRYSAYATIPSTTTEIGVALCFTPVGTAGTNDYVALDGIQLLRNNAAAAYVNSTTGYNAALVPALSFDRRLASSEALNQYRYYWQYNEQTNAYAFGGMAIATNTESVLVNLPTLMRTVPTCTFTNGGFDWHVGTTTGAVSTLVQGTSTAQIVNINDTATGTNGNVAMMYGTAGSGKVKCSAEE